MPHIAPTIGRVVWFHPGKAVLGLTQISKDQPMKADIVYVWDDTRVNLSVVDHVGEQHARTSVHLVQAGDAPNADEPWCEWMPYQLGQAAKTEQALNQAVPGRGPSRSIPSDRLQADGAGAEPPPANEANP